jgi:hypothetical protein
MDSERDSETVVDAESIGVDSNYMVKLRLQRILLVSFVNGLWSMV